MSKTEKSVLQDLLNLLDDAISCVSNPQDYQRLLKAKEILENDIEQL
jgi:hypothetical protein